MTTSVGANSCGTFEEVADLLVIGEVSDGMMCNVFELRPRQESFRAPVPSLQVLPHAHVKPEADFLQIGWQLVKGIPLAGWFRID